MDTNITRRDYTRTHNMLNRRHASSGQRQAMWNTVETNADVEKAEAADRAADKLVKYAFYHDTMDINCLENCLRVHVSDIIRISGWQPAMEFIKAGQA